MLIRGIDTSKTIFGVEQEIVPETMELFEISRFPHTLIFPNGDDLETIVGMEELVEFPFAHKVDKNTFYQSNPKSDDMYIVPNDSRKGIIMPYGCISIQKGQDYPDDMIGYEYQVEVNTRRVKFRNLPKINH